MTITANILTRWAGLAAPAAGVIFIGKGPSATPIPSNSSIARSRVLTRRT